MIASSLHRGGAKVIRVDMPTPPLAKDQEEVAAEMFRLSIREDLEALERQISMLKAGDVDASIYEQAKKAYRKIKDTAEAARKAAAEKYEKWKAAHATKPTQPHDTDPKIAPIPHATPVPHASHIVIDFPKAYAERMDTYISSLNTLLELMLKAILVKTNTAPDQPETPGDGPDTLQPETAPTEGCYYILQR